MCITWYYVQNSENFNVSTSTRTITLDRLDRAPHLCSYLPSPPPLHLLTHTPMFRVLSIENEVLCYHGKMWALSLWMLLTVVFLSLSVFVETNAIIADNNDTWTTIATKIMTLSPLRVFFLLSIIFLLILTRHNDMYRRPRHVHHLDASKRHRSVSKHRLHHHSTQWRHNGSSRGSGLQPK